MVGRRGGERRLERMSCVHWEVQSSRRRVGGDAVERSSRFCEVRRQHRIIREDIIKTLSKLDNLWFAEKKDALPWTRNQPSKRAAIMLADFLTATTLKWFIVSLQPMYL